MTCATHLLRRTFVSFCGEKQIRNCEALLNNQTYSKLFPEHQRNLMTSATHLPRRTFVSLCGDEQIRNCDALLNNHAYSKLFPDKQKSGPLFIKMHQLVLRVLRQTWNEDQPWMCINYRAFKARNSEERLTPFQQYLVIVFNCDASPLAKVILKVNKSTWGGFCHTCPIKGYLEADSARKSIHEEFNGTFLRLGQKFETDVEGIDYQFEVIGHERGDPSPEEMNRHPFGQINERTAIQFQMALKGDETRILLVETVRRDQVESLTFKIDTKKVMYRTKDEEHWYSQEDYLPLGLPISKIKAELFKNYHAHGAVIGDKLSSILDDQWRFTTELRHASLHADAESENSMPKRYPLPDLDAVQFAASKNIHLIEDDQAPITPKSVTFVVCQAKRLSEIGTASACVDARELKAAIQKRITGKAIFKGFCFNVQLTSGIYKIETYGGTFDSEDHRFNSNQSPPWSISGETEIKLSQASGIDIRLVDSDQPLPLQEVTFEVINRMTEKKSSEQGLLLALGQRDSVKPHLFLRNDTLEKLVRSTLVEGFFQKQAFILTTENHEKIKLVAKAQCIHPDHEQEFHYGYLGQLTTNTKLNFTVPANERLSILTRNTPKSYEELEERCRSLNLGGTRKQMERIIREIYTSRGPDRNIREALGLKPPKGVLLYGLPGTGKTTFARQLGAILGCENDQIRLLAAPELLDKYVGETERLLRDAFEPARKAFDEFGQESQLYLIVIDEIETLIPHRNQAEKNHVRTMVNQFLSLIDGLKELPNIMVIGTTNRRDLIDPAALRPGRFDIQVEFEPSNIDGREETFRIYLAPFLENTLLDSDVDIRELARRTEGYTGAEIEGVVRIATSFFLQRILKNRSIDEPPLTLENVKETSEAKLTMKECLDAIEQFTQNRA